MRFFRFTLFLGKDTFSLLLLLTLAFGSSGLSSCEDDVDRFSPSSHISFFPKSMPLGIHPPVPWVI